MGVNFAVAREKMVDNQIRTADVTRHDLIAAFLDVPRERFIPPQKQALAYVDKAVEVAPGRAIMPPAAFARLLQIARIGPGDVVLDIGCATGYSAAVLSRLCYSVVALESDHGLADAATEALAELEYDNAVVVEGPLTEGYPPEGPFDVLFLEGSIGRLPDTLLAQLRSGGRLVAVIGHGNAAMATVWLNDDGHISSRPHFNCAIPPLPGFERKPEFVF